MGGMRIATYSNSYKAGHSKKKRRKKKRPLNHRKKLGPKSNFRKK